MVTISCYYNHYSKDPINFTFIKYEKYIKVILNYRHIIITINELVKDDKLFQIYILSLLCTECTDMIAFIYGKYRILTQRYWKNLYFTNYYKLIELSKSKNPLNTKEPNRISSGKKIRKFNKLFNSYLYKINDPIQLIEEYYLIESIKFKKYIKYEVKIYILSCIIHNYGRDIYNLIKNYI